MGSFGPTCSGFRVAISCRLRAFAGAKRPEFDGRVRRLWLYLSVVGFLVGIENMACGGLLASMWLEGKETGSRTPAPCRVGSAASPDALLHLTANRLHVELLDLLPPREQFRLLLGRHRPDRNR